MPAVTRLGDLNTGHDSCAPVALASASPNVFINGKGAGRVGDTYAEHGCKSHSAHAGTITSGSSTVFVNGKPIACVGDAVSCGGTVAQGSPNVFVGNNNEDNLERIFKIAYTVISNSAFFTEGDRVLLAIPQISQVMATKASDHDAIGWNNLSRLLKLWLSGKAYHLTRDDELNGIAPIVQLDLDWSWYMGYSRCKDTFSELTKELVLTKNAQEVLIERLQADGVWEKGGTFKFSKKPKEEWIKWYYTSKNVPRSKALLDGMDALLASHSIRLLADGVVTVDHINKRRVVEVKSVLPFIYDTFNFDGDDDYGYWSIDKQDMATILIGKKFFSYYNVTNSDFTRFRQIYGKGKDFVVLSKKGTASSLLGKSFIVPFY